MATLEEDAWKQVKRWAEEEGSSFDRCLLDLRRRVEALEQRALTAPEPSAAEPAPAADRPLWKVMAQARYNSDGPRMGSVRLATAAEIDAVADWFDARAFPVDAVAVLHAEARRAREGA